MPNKFGKVKRVGGIFCKKFFLPAEVGCAAVARRCAGCWGAELMVGGVGVSGMAWASEEIVAVGLCDEDVQEIAGA
jgi:hypothetical protein